MLKNFENLINKFSCYKNNKKQLNKYVWVVEGVLSELEDKAAEEGLEQTSRILASLGDVLTVNNINDLSPEQIELLCSHMLFVLNKWENVTREIHLDICKDLLKHGLTWLPVTDHAQKDIEKARVEYGL